jgi:7-cyano-7-deazaguanine synthase
MKTVVTLSGGLDSSVLATYLLRKELHELRTVSFSYGQRHERAELMAARNVAGELGIPHAVLSLNGVTGRFDPDSSQLLASNPAHAVPEGHYAEDNMKATVVPGRNLLMIAAATAYASSHGYDSVAMAAHSGDHPIYPDCRPQFLMAAATATALGYGVNLLFPFADRTKAEIAALGATLDAPLGMTWSCYNGQALHCGRCGTCVERAEAFHLAGVPDPTQYEDPDFFRTVTQGATP